MKKALAAQGSGVNLRQQTEKVQNPDKVTKMKDEDG